LGAAYRRRPQDPLALSLRATAEGYVSESHVIAAKSCRCAVPSHRVTTRVKRHAVFHLSSGVILEPASGFYCATLLILSLKKARGDSEILLNGAASRPVARRPREGTAQRQDFQPVTAVPET